MHYSLEIKNQIRNSPTLNFSPGNLKGEKWKDIPDFEGLYELSNYGRIRSIGRWIDRGSYDYYRPGRMITLRLSRNGAIKKDSGPEIGLQVKL